MNDQSVKKVNISSLMKGSSDIYTTNIVKKENHGSERLKQDDASEIDFEDIEANEDIEDNEDNNVQSLVDESFFEDSKEENIKELDNFLHKGGKKKKNKKDKKDKKDNESDVSFENISDASDASDASDSSSDTSDALSSVCTIDLLSNDPLFIVLSQFFMSRETGDNIVTVMEKLNKNLETLITSRRS